MNHAVTVRPIAPADYAEVARITAAAYMDPGYFDSIEHPYVQKIMRVGDRAAVAPILVAERDGVVVGSVTLAVYGDEWADMAFADELEFRLLVVDPAVQRTGAGRALVQAVIEKARGMDGIRAVGLTTGNDWFGAHALYEALGFTRVPERDWPIPESGKMLRVYRMDL